jgi:ADP-ribose pyrophosphatase YjhB (NUDIX family)
MRKGWLSESDWARVRQSVPIACADVFVWDGEHAVDRVGLIHRDTPMGQPGWCLVGGRLFFEETLAEGITRQLHETLGDAVRFTLEPEPNPIYVAQYFPHRRDAGLIDPRQHALGMVFGVKVDGEIKARGEAHEFRWFDVANLPPAASFGFGQDRVVQACLEKMKAFRNELRTTRP